MDKKSVISFLLAKTGYQKVGANKLATMLNSNVNTVREALKEIRINKPLTQKSYSAPEGWNIEKFKIYAEAMQLPSEMIKEVIESIESKNKQSTPISKAISAPEPFKGGNPDNVLVIGDLHSPWILTGYLEFCRNLQEKYNCQKVIFIGDILDAHSWSFHTHNPDGMSVNDELDKAIEGLKPFYHTFPNAICLFGNHDLLIARKAMDAGLSKKFIKDFGDVVEAPKTWEFKHEHIENNVKYIHGSVGDAIKRAKDERVSICQGHLHSQSFVEWAVSEKDAIFGLQVGCGLDKTAYAFEYAQPFPKKPIISAGVVLEKGTLPIIELMKL